MTYLELELSISAWGSAFLGQWNVTQFTAELATDNLILHKKILPLSLPLLLTVAPTLSVSLAARENLRATLDKSVQEGVKQLIVKQSMIMNSLFLLVFLKYIEQNLYNPYTEEISGPKYLVLSKRRLILPTHKE